MAPLADRGGFAPQPKLQTCWPISAPSNPAIVGAEMLRRNFYEFGEIGPSTVVLDPPSNLDFLSTKSGRRAIEARSAKTLRRLCPTSIEVRSLSQPLGVPLVEPSFGQESNLFRDMGDMFKRRITVRRLSRRSTPSTSRLEPQSPEDRNHITRFDVIFRVRARSRTASVESLASGSASPN